jgi:hypothetical protein
MITSHLKTGEKPTPETYQISPRECIICNKILVYFNESNTARTFRKSAVESVYIQCGPKMSCVLIFITNSELMFACKVLQTKCCIQMLHGCCMSSPSRHFNNPNWRELTNQVLVPYFAALLQQKSLHHVRIDTFRGMFEADEKSTGTPKVAARWLLRIARSVLMSFPTVLRDSKTIGLSCCAYVSRQNTGPSASVPLSLGDAVLLMCFDRCCVVNMVQFKICGCPRTDPVFTRGIATDTTARKEIFPFSVLENCVPFHLQCSLWMEHPSLSRCTTHNFEFNSGKENCVSTSLLHCNITMILQRGRKEKVSTTVICYSTIQRCLKAHVEAFSTGWRC